MNRVEAKWLLLRSLAEYHQFGYEQLRPLVGENRHVNRQASSGLEYQLEFDFLWDSRPGGAIRVLANIDDGGWRAIYPLSFDCLISPPQIT